MNIEISKDGESLFVDGKKRKISTHHSGYKRVNIKGKHFSIHRLMAEKYLPNPEKKEQVNHINGNRGDNRIENLEWVSRSENQKHAYNTLGVKPRTQRRLVDMETANIIKQKYSNGITQKQLALEYGFKSESSIWNLINKKTYFFE